MSATLSVFRNPSAGRADFVVCGLAPGSAAPLRDRVFVDGAAMPSALGWLAEEGLAEAVVLATGDRVEIVAYHANAGQVRAAVRTVLGRIGRVPPDELDPALHVAAGRDAVRHVFAVAASLESKIVGAPQLLAQLRDAHGAATLAGRSGPALDALFAAAYGAAQRVRAETGLGERPAAMAGAAIRLARDLCGDLGQASALLLGDGEIGEFLIRRLMAAGLRRITVAAPSAARAEKLAAALDCHVADFDCLGEALARADIAIGATNGRRLVLTAGNVRPALRKRRRPLLLIDAASPGDIDPGVAALAGAVRHDLAGLEAAAAGPDGGDAAAAAWRIVDATAAAFLRGRDDARGATGIAALRAHFDAERIKALETVRGDGAAEGTRLLVNRLLHGPALRLRALAAEAPERHEAAEETLAEIFALTRDGAGAP